MTDPSGSPPVVDLRGAAFGYRERAVTLDLDLRVHRGERIAVLGPNGCGKSTLLKGLLGLSDHLAGRVELFGTPLARFRQHPRLGYVPQRHTPSAAVPATVTEIVATGRLPHLGMLGRLGGSDRRIVAEAIDLVGLADVAGHEVATLSGGQQRRVLIARALAAQPEVFLLDEPTAGVDEASWQALVAALERLVDDGATLLVVTHELEAVRPLLTRVVMLRAGRIRFDGTPAEYAQTLRAAPAGPGTDPLPHPSPPVLGTETAPDRRPVLGDPAR